MTVARYKDLVLDANDASLLGRFWQQALGGKLVDLDDGDARLDPAPGRPPGELIWINTVPEKRTVKTRVHLDLRIADPTPEKLLQAGATLVRPPGEDHWWVLADPEGNEFCAFPPSDRTPPDQGLGVFELVVDSADPRAQAEWWASVVGGTVEQGDNPWAWIEGAAGFPWPYWVFNPVPEPKTVKNRMHWDVQMDDPEPTALVSAGAVVVREPDDEIRWWVMADPEGNEFCAFAPK